MAYVNLNGALMAAEDAAVRPDDRSFRYGDGLFETIPVHGGLPYLWERHRARLKSGMAALSYGSVSGLLSQALQLIRANAVQEGILRIQVSRGSGGRGYLPAPLMATPTVVMETMERSSPPEEPVVLACSTYERISPKALPTQYKLAQGLNSTLARIEAFNQDCFDALQLGTGGIIAEASSANIFWRLGGTLYTPSLESGALGGVTRQRMMELSPYTVCEGLYEMGYLMEAEAVMLTNAAFGAIAVKGLKDTAAAWESRMLAKEFNTLRNKDIEDYGARFRELLART